LNKELAKLKSNLDGIRAMNSLPDMIFVVDTVKESLAIHEARSLGIPIMAIIDTNSDPDFVDYPIPGNDDSIKAIQLYCEAIDNALSKIKVPQFGEKRILHTGQSRRPLADQKNTRAGERRKK
jgi:small subunit ribosomal protein S2